MAYPVSPPQKKNKGKVYFIPIQLGLIHEFVWILI